MNTTVEISMYPLREDYERQVISFIKELRKSEQLAIRTNAMSTQVVGPISEVFSVIQQAIQCVYADGITAAFVIKVLPGGHDLDYVLSDKS